MSEPAAPAIHEYPKKLCLTNWQSPGDVLCLTGAVRDLHRAYPGRYITDVRTSAGAIWDHNPHITHFDGEWVDIGAAMARDARPPKPLESKGVLFLPMQYPAVHKSNQASIHFCHAFHRELEALLNVQIECTEFKPEIFLSDQEKGWMSQVAELGVGQKFWIVDCGGKWDFTAKWPNPYKMQEVINHFTGRLVFVQVGDNGNWHPHLSGCINLIGQTDLRQIIRLMYHASGVITPITFFMHLAAAVPTAPGQPPARACVVLAGGREPAHWEAYPQHRFLSLQGSLPCCTPWACWKSRCTLVKDGDEKDTSACTNFNEYPPPDAPLSKQKLDVLRVAKCLDMISAEQVIGAIESYYKGGVL